ncbi:MAG: ABC transporter ATP-binding protein [Promethearchaeota archaeon]
MPSVCLENVSLSLGGREIIKNLNLKINDGEYFALVGETGAGKTSILKLICGLHVPDSGKILVGDKDYTRIPAENRGIGMVFEDYALFPHYNVMQNVCYSYRVQDIDPDETRKAARELLNLMLIMDRDDAMPSELSGGMKQRIALARSLMTNSGVLLLDDPLSALDAGLRMKLRIELKNLAKELGTTVIHSTNDIEEAMIVGNRVAIIKDGMVEQIGTPDEIYYKPKNLYVLSFLSDVNLFKCTVSKIDIQHGFYHVLYGKHQAERTFRVSQHANVKNTDFKEGDTVVLAVRSENFHIMPRTRKKPNRIRGTIDEISFLGNIIRYEVLDEFGNLIKVQRFVNEKTKHLKFQIGQEVRVSFSPRLAFLFPYDKTFKDEILF